MESNEGTTPPPPVNRSKTSVYTPCRRFGLSRKSPVSSGGWKAPKSNLNSPSEKIVENKSNVAQEIIGGDVKNQGTPKRTSSSLSYECPRKIPKIDNSPSVARHLGGCNSRLSRQFKAPAVVKPDSLKDSDSLPPDITSIDNVTEKIVQDLKMRIKRKEEELKDRKQALIYKKKHDVKTTRMLIETWREGCQNALRELHSILRMQGHQYGLEQIINNYGIPHNLVRYSAENDDFE